MEIFNIECISAAVLHLTYIFHALPLLGFVTQVRRLSKLSTKSLSKSAN